MAKQPRALPLVRTELFATLSWYKQSINQQTAVKCIAELAAKNIRKKILIIKLDKKELVQSQTTNTISMEVGTFNIRYSTFVTQVLL